jgi:hypothetical protein
MKSQKMLSLLICLVAFSQVYFGQKKNAEIVLVDSIVEPECEYLLNRLDNLVVEVQNTPNLIGYVVIYGGSNQIENIFYERAIRGHAKFRNLDESRYRVITAKPEQKLKIEFWTSKNKDKPNVSEETFKYTLSKNSPRILFAEDSVELVKIDGKLTYLLGSCAACCLITLDLNLLSKFLEENPNINAQIIIYSKSAGRANQLSKLFLSEAAKDYKIPRSRLETKYGGLDGRTAKLHKSVSTVEIWFVPRRQK